MSGNWKALEQCLGYIREKTNFLPRLAVVLGSGLGGFAGQVDICRSFAYSELPGFPVSTVSGHEGRLLLGYVDSVPVAIMQGRVHYYEGYSMQEVVLPVRLMRLLGADSVILTNAAGGINRTLSPGSFMLIRDHIASLVPSPLIGENMEQLGTRFPDMSEVYDREYREMIRQAAARTGTVLHEGVYLQTTGPQYETPAEIELFARWGADAVGMSTACEAIAARHAGLRVCAISCISNMAAGISPEALTHEEVKQTADRVSGQFERLLHDAVLAVGEAG
mgnify:CR=1 FL=1